MRTILLLLGSLVLPVASTMSYIVSIIRGKSRPQRMTRLLLLIITALSTLTLWAQHDISGIWLSLVSFMQALFIWVLSFKRGMGGRDRLDFVCLGLCALGLALWVISGQAWQGLLAAIVADFVAVLPSIRKTIRWPHTELALFYGLDVIAGILVVLAGPLTLRAMVFPAYIAAINLVFFLAIVWPRSVVVGEEA